MCVCLCTCVLGVGRALTWCTRRVNRSECPMWVLPIALTPVTGLTPATWPRRPACGCRQGTAPSATSATPPAQRPPTRGSAMSAILPVTFARPPRASLSPTPSSPPAPRHRGLNMQGHAWYRGLHPEARDCATRLGKTCYALSSDSGHWSHLPHGLNLQGHAWYWGLHPEARDSGARLGKACSALSSAHASAHR